MSDWAVVFPGQGSQSVGMIDGFADAFPCVRTIFSDASDVLGYDLFSLVSSGPASQLNQTIHTQPALLVSAYAIWQCRQSLTDTTPTLMAGHSLGEYTALLCSGVLSFGDALRLVSARAQAMQQAVPEGVGAMAVIVGLPDDQVKALCLQAADNDILSPANYNSIGQVVVAGHYQAVLRVMELAKEANAKLARLLPVSVPSHCLLMQPALDQLLPVLSEITWHQPTVPVIQNYDVIAHTDLQAIQHSLLQQMISPVQWVSTIKAMQQRGVSRIIECGPGKVLTGLIKRIDRSLVCSPTQSVEDLRHAVSVD